MAGPQGFEPWVSGLFRSPAPKAGALIQTRLRAHSRVATSQLKEFRTSFNGSRVCLNSLRFLRVHDHIVSLHDALEAGFHQLLVLVRHLRHVSLKSSDVLPRVRFQCDNQTVQDWRQLSCGNTKSGGEKEASRKAQMRLAMCCSRGRGQARTEA